MVVSCMCGTKLKNDRVLVLCPVVSHVVVSCRVVSCRICVNYVWPLWFSAGLKNAFYLHNPKMSDCINKYIM